MDTGGKDGAIKKICSGLDPNGVQLTNFKVPSADERDHDFLWRIHANAPRKGSIGIWNRSHYEDVLVPRVHKQINEKIWRERCEDINAFERLLCRNGVNLLKFFLHISKEEQKAPTRSAAARSAEALEVQHRRPEGARALGRLSARLRRRDQPMRDRLCAVAHRPGRSQMGAQSLDARDGRAHARADGTAISAPRVRSEDARDRVSFASTEALADAVRTSRCLRQSRSFRPRVTSSNTAATALRRTRGAISRYRFSQPTRLPCRR